MQKSVLANGAEDHDVGHDDEDGRRAVAEDPEPFLVELTSPETDFVTRTTVRGRVRG